MSLFPIKIKLSEKASIIVTVSDFKRVFNAYYEGNFIGAYRSEYEAREALKTVSLGGLK